MCSLFLIAQHLAAGQPELFRVMLAKKAFDGNGQKIKTNAAINRYQTVLVKEGGSLEMDVESRLDLVLGPGSHNLDELERQHSYRYRHHDSLKLVIYNKGMLNCKFQYQQLVVPGASNTGYDPARIRVQSKPLTTFDPDPEKELTIAWENPNDSYKGNYLLVIQDAFNTAYLDLIETKNTSVTIYPASYDVPYLQYFIRAEDCRGSAEYGLKRRD